MNILDILMHSTVRLEVAKTDGSISFGTGFTYWVKSPINPPSGEPTIITNAHVFRNAQTVSFHIKHKDQANPSDTALSTGVRLKVNLPNSNGILFHPDVDLAMLPIGNILELYCKSIGEPYSNQGFVYLPASLIPTPEFLANLNPVEDLLMIGYPSALWDSHRNLPIFRSGRTASHPAYPFDGQKYFLTDLPVFEGSSGSPVFLFNFGAPYFDRSSNSFVWSSRIKLLGINAAVKTMPSRTTGQLAPGVNIQLSSIDRMDLGVTIFSSEIHILEEMLYRKSGVL